MHVLIVKFHSALPDPDVRELLERRTSSVLVMPGLLQKYYTREASSGDHVGVHVFESEESLDRYRNSEVSRSLPSVYQTTSPPRVEVFEVLFQLR
jgi:hypothetical protein